MARRKRLEVLPDGQVQITDPETLKVLADPLRLELLTLLVEPNTAKQLAAAVGVPTTRLYYHLRVLEAHGLIRVVSTRLVSGIEEKTYRGIGNNFVPAPGMTDAAIESSGVIGSIVDLVQAELSVAMRAAPSGHIGDVDSAAPVLTLTRMSFDKQALIEFQKGLYDLIEQHVRVEPDPPDGEELYHLFAAVYRYTPPITPSEPARKKRGTRAPRS